SVFKACCPFHKEKTPSFVVNPARRTYHCFGCGAHGDVFKFLMQMDGMPFMDAVRALAERALVPLDTQVDYEAATRQTLIQMHGDLAAFYHRCLLRHSSAAQARAYLQARQLDAATIERFGIGYAPPLPRTLQQWAVKHGYTLEQLVEGGLLAPPRDTRGSDDYYDRFRGRLMFPLRDASGRVVGFSGRILDPKASPAKYVNSPETPVFHKGRILYALDVARAHIVKQARREALVCEGQIDVIRCHACGFNTAVAAQGTAFTVDHVQLLKRYADSVVLVYDGDAAGRKAALRTGELFLQADLPVRVAAIPPGQDPDSLLRDQGPEAFQALLDAAVSITAFQISTLQAAEQNPGAVDAVGRVADQVLALLAGCSKAVLRSHLLQEAADRLHLPPSALESDLENLLARRRAGDGTPAPPAPATTTGRAGDDTARAPSRPGANPAARPAPSAAVAPPSLAFSLCGLLLHHADDAAMMQRVCAWLPLDLLTEPEARDIVQAAVSLHVTGEDRLSLLATEGPPATRAWIERLARRESPMLHTQEISPCQAAEDMLARIWIETLKRERQQLDSADEAQAGRRYALTRLIKALEQVAPWEARTALLTAELARHEPVLSAPSA
ncbi:MAG: DNA primase, partial [Lentisphaerae bacterium]|nr:DNA primase [Lentisphaerota bacterium]